MQLLTYPRVEFDEKNIKKELVVKAYQRTRKNRYHVLRNLRNIIQVKHDILSKQRSKNKPNYKPVCNHAKDIADTSTGVFHGKYNILQQFRRY